MAQTWKFRLIRHHGFRRVWWGKYGLFSPCDCHGRNIARQCIGGPELWCTFKFMRQSNLFKRHRRTKTALFTQFNPRRSDWRVGHERSQCRLRCGQHAIKRQTRWQRLSSFRQQNVDHQWSRCRCIGRVRQNRPDCRQQRHYSVYHRKNHARLFYCPKTRQIRHARLQHL